MNCLMRKDKYRWRHHGALTVNGAKLYDEQFAKVFPSDWEMAVLSKHLDSAKSAGTGVS